MPTSKAQGSSCLSATVSCPLHGVHNIPPDPALLVLSGTGFLQRFPLKFILLQHLQHVPCCLVHGLQSVPVELLQQQQDSTNDVIPLSLAGAIPGLLWRCKGRELVPGKGLHAQLLSDLVGLLHAEVEKVALRVCGNRGRRMTTIAYAGRRRQQEVPFFLGLGQLILAYGLVVQLLQAGQGPQDRHPVSVGVRAAAGVLRQPKHPQAGQPLQVTDLTQALDVVLTQIELGQVLALAEGLQAGDLVDAEGDHLDIGHLPA